MTSTTTYQRRRAGLEQELASRGLAAVAAMPGPNLVYLLGLGFHLSERPVLGFFARQGDPLLLVPAFEAGKADLAPYPCRVVGYSDEAGPAPAFRDALAILGLDGQRLGVEARRFRFLETALVEAASDRPVLVAADDAFAALRMRKDEDELAAMRQAVAVAEAGLLATLPAIRPGVTEKAVAAELTLQTLRAGSDSELPFTPIIASGPHGANPHAFPTERVLQAGDLVTVDWGASWEGYFADITRTYHLAGADVDPRLVAAYHAVEAANAAGRAAVRPGTNGQAVDHAARQVIQDAGLGDYFTHRTGHGLGLEGHEEPDMKAGSILPLEVGMTFTVEPGVYLPGIGGVRIEDDMVVTASGGDSLTSLPRGLMTIG